MNNKVKFAVNILKKYANENGEIIRGTTDISPLEEWLIMRLYELTEAKSSVKVEAEVMPEIAEVIDKMIKENSKHFDKKDADICWLCYEEDFCEHKIRISELKKLKKILSNLFA